MRRSLVAVFAWILTVTWTLSASGQSLPDYFIDSRGNRIEFRPVYEGWFGERRYPKNYGRAIGENAAMLGFELFIYWYDPNQNSVDWQFPDLWSKLAHNSIARFDDNLERTNWLFHPSAGAMHYGLTRVNGFGVLPSFGVAAVSSALYETVFEWREIISINDLIVTPFGGMAVGEFFFHLGNYLNSEQPRQRTLDEAIGPDVFGRRLGSLALGLPRHINNDIDEPSPAPLVPDDALGLSSAYTHRFDLNMGEDFITNDRRERSNVTVLGTSAELVAMPGFLHPGHIDTWFGGGNFTRFSIRVAFDGSLRDVDVQADSHLFGHFGQNLEAGRGGVYGAAHEIGGHTAIQYVDRWLFGRRDQYALLHLLGPVGNLWLGQGATKFHFGLDISPDFAAPYSLAYEGWSAAYGQDGTKSSLLAHGYYFAWGASAGASASVSIDGFSIGADGRYGHYESLDGAERMQEKVTRDVHLRDDVLELFGRLSFEPKDTLLSLKVEGAHFGRRSEMAPVTTRRSDERLGASLGIHF
jgi:hypothetical protein